MCRREDEGLDNCLPNRIGHNGGIYWLDDAKEVPDPQVVTYDYGDPVLVWEMHSFQSHHPLEGTSAGTAFYGTEGTVIVDDGWTVYGPENKVVASAPSGGGLHTGNFIACMKSRGKSNADAEWGGLSTTITHLGNISSLLGREVKFDPKTET